MSDLLIRLPSEEPAPPKPPAPPREVKHFDANQPFWKELRQLFFYPCQGTGLIAIPAGAVALTLIWILVGFFTARVDVFGPASVFGGVIGYGAIAAYASLYLRAVIRCSSRGEAEPPPWPWVEERWDDLVVPLFRMLAPFAVCYGVAILCWLAKAPAAIPLFFAALGTIYFPMSLLVLAMMGQVLTSLDPRVVVAAMTKVKREYLIALAFIFGAAVVGTLAHVFLALVPYALGVFLSWLVTVYLVIFAGHLLGRLYALCREERLGPFFLSLARKGDPSA